MAPAVTVLMPVYNGARYVQATIATILEQTFTDFEFLIIDDGSTDATEDIVRTFKDDRIRLLKNQERLKLSGALNRGLEEANGKFVARMDADDLAVPDRLETQVRLLNNSPDVGVCGGWIQKFGMGRKEVNRFPESAELVKAYALFDCPLAHPTVMLRKSFFDQYELRYNGAYYPTEDYELWSRCLELFPCVNIPRVLLKYRVHAGSMTCSDWKEMDGKAALIAGRKLQQMGLNPTEDEMRFHRNIGRGESFHCQTMDQVHLAEKWLQQLKQTNEVKHVYDDEAFGEMLSLVWFRLCFHATHLGVGILRRYYAGRPTQVDRKVKQRACMIALSVIKNRLRPATVAP